MTASVLVGLTLFVLSWIFASLLAYFLHKFYKIKDEIVIIKRRGNIVIKYTICAMIVFLISTPYQLIVSWDWSIGTQTHPILHTIALLFDDLVFIPYYVAALLSLLRYWLIYYDIQFSKSCLNLQWKSCINSNFDTLKSDKWFSKHRNNYGNQSFMIKRTTIICAVFCSIIIPTGWLYDFRVITIYLFPIVIVSLFSFILLALIFLSRKMPRDFQDNIHLRKEAVLISYSWITALLMYGLLSIIEVIIGRNLFTAFLVYVSAMIAAFATPFISTFWVMQQIKIHENVVFEYTIKHKNSGLELMQILGSEKLFELYMQHLIKEFSMECLLSLIEFTQFKKHAIEALMVDPKEFEHDEIIVFPESVPLSDIVYGKVNELDSCHIRVETNSNETSEETSQGTDVRELIKEKAHELYCKYVEMASEFEINISYKIRAGMMKTFSDCDKWMNNEMKDIELIRVFDTCIEEMIKLLNSSMHRFKFDK